MGGGMTMRFRTIVAAGAQVLLGAGLVWAQAVSLEPCSMCHDELAQQFTSNPHLHALATVTAPSVGTPCETCHGDGTKHADEGDPSLITVPRTVADDGICLTCHTGDKIHADMHVSNLAAAVHRTGGVGCVDCHTIHGNSFPAEFLLAEPVDDLCASCHPSERAAFRKPFAHDLDAAATSCVSCHDPHAGPGSRALKTARTGEIVCVTCHVEKQGPFVFEHVTGVAGDCLTCHEPHGSSNPMQLVRSRVHQLCLECHSVTPGLLGSQPPSFHDLRQPRYRDCTVCHVAVHGSNSSPALLK